MTSYRADTEVMLDQGNDNHFDPTGPCRESAESVKYGSPEIRTQDQSVKSRVLYR